jgi:ribosomal protein L37E
MIDSNLKIDLWSGPSSSAFVRWTPLPEPQALVPPVPRSWNPGSSLVCPMPRSWRPDQPVPIEALRYPVERDSGPRPKLPSKFTVARTTTVIKPSRRKLAFKSLQSLETSTQVCAHCGTHQTPLWRKIKELPDQLTTVCNRCGLRWKTHRAQRS